MIDVVLSSGHGKYVRGASGYIDEVDEARKVVEQVAADLRKLGSKVVTFHDDVSQSQDENLHRIVDFHNSQGPHEWDVSVHFNANVETEAPMGTEVLYITQEQLAEDVSAAISDAGDFKNRGPKYRDDLFFLRNCAEPAILIETCFVDSKADVALYDENFREICSAIAATLAGGEFIEKPEVIVEMEFSGKCSWFGGPDDMGVDPDEGLAFIYSVNDAPHLFLDEQPPDTTGLARRLDPGVFYIACRWDYAITPKSMLADPTKRAMVRSKKTGRGFLAWPADWGPHEDTDRVADLSPALMEALGIETDDEIEVFYPWKMRLSYGRAR